MGYTDNAVSINEKLQKLYSSNYKCGYLKKIGFGDIAEEPFV
jgi:hypothetical protein